MTAIVPTPPERGATYERALENEVLALRAVVRQVTKAVVRGNGHVHLFDSQEVGSVICCTPFQVDAVERALGNGSGSAGS